MNNRLLLAAFTICTSFCFVSATPNTQETLQNNNTSQQESVITIDVQPKTDNDDAFFRSLIKDINSDHVEYKNGKIFVYVTPQLIHIIGPLFLELFPLFFSFIWISIMNGARDSGAIIVAAVLFIFTTLIEIGLLIISLSNGVIRWIEKHPLITIDKNGIRYREERMFSWSDIKDIVQRKIYTVDEYGNTYTNRTLTCEGTFGTEIFEISEYSYLPITFNEMIELLNKAFYYMKQTETSATNSICLNKQSK